MSTLTKAFLTPEQYLDLERKAEGKSEYYRGEMIPMPGASREHNILATNLVASLHSQLRRRPCELYPSDMRIQVATTGLYTYPDVIVVCEEPKFADNHVDTLLNPTFIAEILSPSTEAYDRGRKFEHYRALESLAGYLLVSQDRVHAELWERQDKRRALVAESSQLGDSLDLSSIGCRIALADLYEKVDVPGIGSE